MEADLLYALVIVACLVFWYWRRAKSDKQSPREEAAPLRSVPEVSSDKDPFIQEVETERVRAQAAISAATAQNKRELEERFANDLKLKERLSQFARDSKLDEALISLWEEIKSYPAWSLRDDFDKWNKLKLTALSEFSERDTKTIAFEFEGVAFKLSERDWSGMGGDSYTDFSLFESGEEVFCIGCSTDYGEYGTTHRCINVSAFKKRGTWAKALLSMYTQIQIERSMTAERLKYFRANEIKSRFEE